MQTLPRFLRSLTCLLLLFASVVAARAADLTHAVLLVASRSQAHAGLEQTVILAAPLDGGAHIGIILNRPTGVQLGQLFPDQPATRAVKDQVYLGGQMLSGVVFAVTRTPPAGSLYLQLTPGLVAVLDGASVDRIIAETPNDARYFAGFMTWVDGELADEIDDGDWIVRPADALTLPPGGASDLWLALSAQDV